MTGRQWSIGDVTITKIVESEAHVDLARMFEGATPEAVRALDWLVPHFATADGRGILSIHALVVDTPDKRILVDTCVGNGKDRREWPGMHDLQTSFLTDLERAGFPRDSIDVVLCTHLHFDHIGWNTMLVDGVWVPTFPNARYLFAREEHAHWAAMEQAAEAADFNAVQRLSYADSVAPVIAAGLADLVDTDHRICTEVRLRPTPGHSPGHVSVEIRSRGEQAFITGDMCHHPCQLSHPEWGMPAIDHDTVEAIATRRKVFADVAGQPVLVIGTHWGGPTAGHVLRDGDTYRLRHDGNEGGDEDH